MKHAYAQYQNASKSIESEKVRQLVERAHIYNVPFLQNTVRVQEIFGLFVDENHTKEDEASLKEIKKVWEWLKQSEMKACMS